MKAPQERKTDLIIDCDRGDAQHYEQIKVTDTHDGVGIHFKRDSAYSDGGVVQGLENVRKLRDALDAYIEYEGPRE